jgi:hypothetical protein
MVKISKCVTCNKVRKLFKQDYVLDTREIDH